MSLPNPSMSFTPFDILTADEMNDLVENIEYLDGIVEGAPPSGVGGWEALTFVNPTVTANGNRSYTAVFGSTDLIGVINPGTRIRTTRTVAAPTQCTSLNGSTQYYSKSSPAGMTFTDDFVVSAWVKLTSYSGSASTIVSRENGTSGWSFRINSSGQIVLVGENASTANFSSVTSYQSIPLNKWVHIAAQLDMSAFTATTTTSYVMINGSDVPAYVGRGGTNPTALIQAGNLEIGSQNTSLLWSGKLSQVAVYSAKVTQANILATISQGLVGTETSLISAYSFNNAITDLNVSNANNLTANGSAVATNADSPFGGQASGLISSTLDYGIVQSATFSTNTTVVVQVPEGCTIPTSGGVSAVSYSSVKVPYGMPTQKDKWTVSYLCRIDLNTPTPGSTTWYGGTQASLSIPIGNWDVGYNASLQQSKAAAAVLYGEVTLSTSSSSQSDLELASSSASNSTDIRAVMTQNKNISLSIATPYYLLYRTQTAAVNNIYLIGTAGATTIRAVNAYL